MRMHSQATSRRAQGEPSEFTRAHYGHIKQEIDYKSKKLLATHTVKRGAKTWCALLGYFLNKGYTISNIKNVFTTRLETPFKSVIELIAQRRTEASQTGDKVAKALCKQNLVSLYGKQGENVTKYEGHKFVCVNDYEHDVTKKVKQARELQKKVANPLHKGFDRLADNSIALHYGKASHKCNPLFKYSAENPQYLTNKLTTEMPTKNTRGGVICRCEFARSIRGTQGYLPCAWVVFACFRAPAPCKLPIWTPRGPLGKPLG